MIFDYGKFDKYRDIANKMRMTLASILPQIQIDMVQHSLLINDLTINEEI